MKLWLKIFIGTIVVFIIAFDAGALYLTSYSYNFNRQRETDNGIREHEMISSSISSRIANAERIYPDAPYNNERLTAIISPLADFYMQQGVLLALYGDDGNIYSNIPSIGGDLLDLEKTQSKNIMEETVGSTRYVLVASKISDYPNLTFVYARDISQIDDFRTNIGRVFFIVNVIVLVFLGISLYFLLRHMTKPVAELTSTASRIADGEYDKRVSVSSNDELGLLADSFNRMASSVEEHTTWLKKASEEKQQFIDDLTHELKTPLTSILGYSEYLQNAKSTEEDRITAAGHLHQMALRLKNLSEKLLDLTFSRDENMEFQMVDIPALFAALKDVVRPALLTSGIDLITSPDIQYIIGDEVLLLSMLKNLVENAARASNKGASVIVRAYRTTDPIIEVSDAGCGIEKCELSRITAPFYRVDKSRSRLFGGIGLGLSIVAQIAVLHNARVEIESEPGVGTTVRIVFMAV